MNQPSDKMWIVFLATYPPRECGIATFTADLVHNFDQLFTPREETKIIAVNPDVLQTYDYSKKVILQISENKSGDYLAAAQKLNNMPEVKLVSIQHEFGIFGADYGKNLLIFMEELKKPMTVTFHTVLPNPTPEMKSIVQKIIKLANRLIVMTNSSKEILKTVYDAPTAKIAMIHHGIHPLHYTDGKSAKLSLGHANKKILSTFGMLGRGKGIEEAISALPEIIKAYPDVIYLVIGATHPVVLRHEGESYRQSLIDLACQLGIQDHVIFYNEYLEINELLKFLQATDIYLSLSQDPNQAVSGTLTYALGAGRPVISTPFPQAQELLTKELGALVKFNDSDSIAQEVIKLFSNKERLLNMSKTAYFRTRGMTWPNVALSYMREFIKVSPELAKKEKNLPAVKLEHLLKLTDDFGIFQFAILDKPDAKWGYTLDDNARALIAVCWYHEAHDGITVEHLANTYLSFLERAAKSEGGFENYFNSDKQVHRTLNADENMEDSSARAMWSLSVAAASNLPKHLKDRALKLLEEQSDKYSHVESPRAIAFHIKALAKKLELSNSVDNDLITNAMITQHANFLLDRFADNATDEWQWFEQSITYSNAVLPEAMLLASKITGDQRYFKAGKDSLDFLVKQSFCGEVCVPIGQSGWYQKGEPKKLYDQQPEEVSALVQALKTMHDHSGEIYYSQKMTQAFNWFLGNNLLNQVVYSQTTGGCYDGLGEHHINLNQGAESTISYLSARLIIDLKSNNKNV